MTQIIAFRKKRPALSLIALLQRSSPHPRPLLQQEQLLCHRARACLLNKLPNYDGPRAALNDAGKLWLMTRSVFRRRCPNTDSRKKKRSSLMQTNVTLYALLASDTKWPGECT